MGDVGCKFLPHHGAFHNIFMLRTNGIHKGLHFLVGHHILKIIHVLGHLSHRCNDALCQGIGQKHTYQQQEDPHCCQNRQKRQQECPDIACILRYTQHTSVIQFHRIIIRIFFQCSRATDGTAFPIRKGLCDFRPLTVIFHLIRICAVIITHRSIRRYHRDPQIFFQGLHITVFA